NWLSGDWPGDNRMEVSYQAYHPCTDVSVQLGLSDIGVKSGGSLTAYVTVNRSDDGPGDLVPVDVTLTTSHGGEKVWTVNLAKGESATLEATFTLNGNGEVYFNAEAWPQGVEDCAPGNNRASEYAFVEAPLPKAKDKGIFVRLIS
ncbi:MAG: hypothetical protein K6T80_06980, partial [Firmicutes bacterium]|nr:hypothetical protein [Bacillota bacterium]